MQGLEIRHFTWPISAHRSSPHIVIWYLHILLQNRLVTKYLQFTSYAKNPRSLAHLSMSCPSWRRGFDLSKLTEVDKIHAKIWVILWGLRTFALVFFVLMSFFGSLGYNFWGKTQMAQQRTWSWNIRWKSDFCNSMIGRSQQIGSRSGNNSLSLFLSLLSTNISK